MTAPDNGFVDSGSSPPAASRIGTPHDTTASTSAPTTSEFSLTSTPIVFVHELPGRGDEGRRIGRTQRRFHMNAIKQCSTMLPLVERGQVQCNQPTLMDNNFCWEHQPTADGKRQISGWTPEQIKDAMECNGIRIENDRLVADDVVVDEDCVVVNGYVERKK
jgi:hypothetical protein